MAKNGSVVTSRKFGRYFAGVADKQNASTAIVNV
jgi:hypothetical protein